MTQYPVIQVKNVSKSFQVGTQMVPVLKDITFDINLSDFLIIFGPSGSGKSVLLHTILGLERSTQGDVMFFGTNLSDPKVTDDQIAELRKRNVGMVYQQSNWIKSLNVLENVAFPLLLNGQRRSISTEKAKLVLEAVGMIDWAKYSPMELSSGQQQMVGLARALVTNPEVIIADEPTGNLDYETGQKLMSYLSTLNRADNKTIVMVTHDLDYLKFANMTVRILNGQIVEIHRGEELSQYVTQFNNKHGRK